MASPRRIRLLVSVVAAVVAGSLMVAPATYADMTTVSVDNGRTSWDSAEPGLGPGVVASSGFGQIFSPAVDGQVYAEPVVADGTVMVATENNTVYGLDPATGAINWTRSDLG